MAEVIDISRNLPVHLTKRPKMRNITPLSGDINKIIVHTTNTTASIEAIAKYDITPGNHISSSGCPTYTYHDTIKESGKVYHCVDYKNETWHAGKVNFSSIAVALNYVAEVKNPGGSVTSYSPKTEMIKSLYKHVGNLCLKFGVIPENVLGHREVPGSGWFWYKGSRRLRKTCPGMYVDLDLMRLNICKYVQLVLKGYDYTGQIDGVWGPKSAAAFRKYLAK